MHQKTSDDHVVIKAIGLMSVGKHISVLGFSETTLRTDFVQILVFSEHSAGEKPKKLRSYSHSNIHLSLVFSLAHEQNFVTTLKTPLQN